MQELEQKYQDGKERNLEKNAVVYEWKWTGPKKHGKPTNSESAEPVEKLTTE